MDVDYIVAPHRSLRELTVGQGDTLAQILTLFAVEFSIVGTLWVVYLRLANKDKEALYNLGSINTRNDDPNIEKFRVALLMITFGAMAVGMHTLNKSLASTLQAPSLIAGLQMVFAVLALISASWKGLVEADRRQLLIWLFMPVLFASMLISSMYTYVFISLSMLTVVRNLAPLFSLPVECYMMPADKQPHITPMTIFSMVVMLCGAVMFVWEGGIDISGAKGIMFAILNMALAVISVTTTRRLLAQECSGIPIDVCTLMNNAFGMIPTLMIAFFSLEISEAMEPANAAKWFDPKVLVLLLLSGMIGTGIGYFGFACQKAIAATSFFVLQNVTKVGVVFMGIVVFGDQVKSLFAASGLIMSVLGSFLYGKSQMDAKEQKEESKRLLEAAEPAKSA